MNAFIEALATLGTLAGLFLLSEQISYGFTVGLFSNILWIWHGHNMPKGGNGIVIVNALMVFINLNGLGVI